MTRHSASLSFAGILLCWSAAFLVFSVLVAGLHASSLMLLAIGVAFFGVARSFLRGSTYWTRFAFPTMLLGAGIAYLMARMHLAVTGGKVAAATPRGVFLNLAQKPFGPVLCDRSQSTFQHRRAA